MNSLQNPGAQEQTSAPRTKVLVADDEIAIAETLRVILINHGFDARAVYGGTPAVEAADAWPPDLLLTDVVMPDLDGIETAIRIRKIVPECKILLLSGNATVHDLVRKARQRGYEFEILFKPIHPRDLLEEVCDLLRRS